MKAIDCWGAMQPYGIVPLTTEPDGLKYRLVCDVTEKGKSLIEKALGIAGIQLEKNWDYGTHDQPHIGSMMLSPELLAQLGVFALFEEGCHEVWATRSKGLIGIQHGDSVQVVQDLQLVYGNEVVHRFIYSESGSVCNPTPAPLAFL